MSFLNYIGEFFLFRWLFCKFRKSTAEHFAHTENLGTSIDRNREYLNDNHDEDIAHDDAAISVCDNLLDDSDNSEDLDDLDRFMRNNKQSHLPHGNYDNDYHSGGRYSGHQDWDSGSYSQSYDDFYEEQDDYDMMDDDF